MLPSLENGQYIIVNKLAYAQIDLGKFDWIPFFDPGDNPAHHLFGTPERGDVIVFQVAQQPRSRLHQAGHRCARRQRRDPRAASYT